MYVVKNGQSQKIDEDTWPYWRDLGWSQDLDQDGEPDDQGGGTGPQYANYKSENRSAASGAFINLPWSAVTAGGADLLDFTDPTQPVMLVDGIVSLYATVKTNTDLSTAGVGHSLYFELDLDANDVDASSWSEFSIDPNIVGQTTGTCQGSLSLRYFVPAGGVLAIGLKQTAAITVSVSAYWSLVIEPT